METLDIDDLKLLRRAIGSFKVISRTSVQEWLDCERIEARLKMEIERLEKENKDEATINTSITINNSSL